MFDDKHIRAPASATDKTAKDQANLSDLHNLARPEKNPQYLKDYDHAEKHLSDQIKIAERNLATAENDLTAAIQERDSQSAVDTVIGWTLSDNSYQIRIDLSQEMLLARNQSMTRLKEISDNLKLVQSGEKSGEEAKQIIREAETASFKGDLSEVERKRAALSNELSDVAERGESAVYGLRLIRNTSALLVSSTLIGKGAMALGSAIAARFGPYLGGAVTMASSLNAGLPYAIAHKSFDNNSGDTQGDSVSVMSSENDVAMTLRRLYSFGEIEADDPAQMVEKMVTHHKPAGVGRLLIEGHGHPASQSLNNGSMELRFNPITGKDFIVLCDKQGKVVRDFEKELSLMSTRLTPNATVKLNGCNVANTELGERFIKRLSEVMRVEVEGTDDYTGPVHTGKKIACKPEDTNTSCITSPANPGISKFVLGLSYEDFSKSKREGDSLLKEARSLSGFNKAEAVYKAASAYSYLYSESKAKALAETLVTLSEYSDVRDINADSSEGKISELYHKALNDLANLPTRGYEYLAKMWPAGRKPEQRAAVFRQLARHYETLGIEHGIAPCQQESGRRQ